MTGKTRQNRSEDGADNRQDVTQHLNHLTVERSLLNYEMSQQ
jgi:hypothetical protein